MFWVALSILDDGFTYLRFKMKPKGYYNQDWAWLIEGFHKKLDSWKYRSLTMGGRMVMMKSMLQNISIYCIHLYLMPWEIIHNIESIMSYFLCAGTQLQEKVHMVRWSTLVRPMEKGGWGFIDTSTFKKDLTLKNMWREVSENGVWSHIIKEKYMFGQNFSSRISNGAKKKSVISHIWRIIMHTLLRNLGHGN